MSLRNWTPCDEPDLEGRHHCPYADDGDYVNCEYWCGADEPEDYPEDWEEEEYWNPYETSEDGWDEWEGFHEEYDQIGFDPYMGCYTDDC